MRAGEASSVSKRYGRQAAVDSVTLAVYRGEIVGLIGPNGAGKTTLLRLFAGLLRPSEGEVLIDNRAPDGIRYFGGEHTLPPSVSARAWLALWTGNVGISADIARDGGRTVRTDRPLGVLSRGTRQQVGLEAMLAGEPPALLLLDEPWEGLDPDAGRWLSRSMVEKRAAGTGILVSSHRLHDLADVCDRCVFLVGGRLVGAGVECAGLVNRIPALLAAFDRAKAST